VREGRIGGHHQELGTGILTEMAAIWRDDIEAQFGLASYQDMVEALECGR
jgi:hypothetical protein